MICICSRPTVSIELKLEEVAEQVRWLCRNIGADGGFILSTCNILIDAIPLENAVATYKMAEEL
jgi:hypothetical protein